MFINPLPYTHRKKLYVGPPRPTRCTDGFGEPSYRSFRTHHFLAFALTFLILGPTVAEEAKDKRPQFDAQSLEFFEREVRPLLVKRCYECHGPDVKKPKGGLRLASRAAILAGGDTGAAIIPGNSKKSLLIDAINYGDLYQMPPKSKLSDKEIAILTKWVDLKAPWPKETIAGSGPRKEFDLERRKREHWCWQPVKQHKPPHVQISSWPKKPLDYFILAKLEETRLKPAAPADRRTLIRRAYFDLIGLPPPPAEVEAFVNDKSTDAFEKVVDQLLESPHFGERWARHWMDLVRYAETYGHEFDYALPHAPRYRDYLIRAFNADVPYDQFVIEHIAGDLLENPRRHPTDRYNESIIGTGFWWLGEATHAPVDVLGDEAGRADNQIDVMSKAFLGLTVACARCHDHKFDAISTKDYYALSGFLKSSRRQEALLDPQGKIRAATAQLRVEAAKGDELIAKAVPRASDEMRREFARYLLASREVMFGTPTDSEREASKSEIVFEDFEKTTFEGWKVTGDAFGQGPILPEQTKAYLGDVGAIGKRFVQTHHRVDGQNSGQTDRKTGTLTSRPFKVERRFITFLIGGGAHKSRTCLNLVVNGKVVRSATGRNQGKLFAHRFDVTEFAGKEAQIQIVDNEKGGWGNVGVDHIVFTDRDNANPAGRPIENVVQESGADSARLARWVSALRDELVNQPSHPLNPWLALARHQGDLGPNHFADQRRRLDEEAKKATARDEQAPVFADFDGADYGDWYVTGDAFGDRPTRAGQWDSRERGSNMARPGVADSGMLAGRHQGVLRSPTFTITHPNIHYRIAGKNAQVRVIVDNYFMDTYNGLLFRGFSMKVDTGGKFIWQSQGGDIGRYLGHRAHIEIIDHGDGFVAVDEIRFATGGLPGAEENSLGRKVFENSELKSLKDLADAYALVFSETINRWHNGKADSRESELINWVMGNQLFGIDTEVSDQLAAVSRRLDEQTKSMPAPVRVLAMCDGSPQNRQIYVRGNSRTLGEEAPRQLLTAIAGSNQPIIKHGSGRLELAKRIVDPANPLTSRVMVNRLWHHLFGRGIVASVDNFGVLGQRPTHPELLDFLASQFVQEGWSVKRMIREIVLSQTYQMSSTPNNKATQIDPQNRLLHRMRIRRLQGEAIRDAILAINGRLDRKREGPSVRVHITAFMQGRGRPGGNGPLDGAGRRSVYTEVRRNFLPPMMLAFDTPQPFSSVGRRNLSNVPAQALILMNDPFVIEQSKIWARRLLTITGTGERIKQIYQSAFSREPTSDEMSNALAFLDQQSREHGIAPDQVANNEQVWADLCHVMINVKEFIFIN